MMEFKYNDGGRVSAGYADSHKGCVARAISIASGLPFEKVYKDLFNLCKDFNKIKTKRYKGDSHPGSGIHKKIYHDYIQSIGGYWIPTMFVGVGCIVHLNENELPTNQKLIVRVSKHLTAVINGVINDTFDPSRDGTRCVYGYYLFE